MEISELVLRARTGDVDAFTELVRRYQAMVFGYAYARLGDFHLAEDIAQQAFITAWRGLDGLNAPERFGGWLRTIVRFECSHALRSRRAEHFPLINADVEDASHEGPATIAERREGVEHVLAAINSLPPAEREAAILFYLQGHSQREVATFLSIPVSTVNNRLRGARSRLKESRIRAMTSNTFNDYRLPDDFAGRIGEIVRAQGPLIDVRFPDEHRPKVLNAFTVTDEGAEPGLIVEAIQLLDDSIVRCITPEGRELPVNASMRLTDTGGPVSVPLDRVAIQQVIDAFPAGTPGPGFSETGIKPIDLFCPLPERGRVAIVGDMQSGKMVLVEELVHRLEDSPSELVVFVFVETREEAAVINSLDYRASANVQAIYLPVPDSSTDGLADLLPGFDAVIAITSELASQRLYPAIDPDRSRSRLLESDDVDPAHAQTALRVRRHLAIDDEGAKQLRRYLSQPFFVAEPWTGRTGAYVPVQQTIRDCATLLDEGSAELDADDLYMIGALPS